MMNTNQKINVAVRKLTALAKDCGHDMSHPVDKASLKSVALDLLWCRPNAIGNAATLTGGSAAEVTAIYDDIVGW